MKIRALSGAVALAALFLALPAAGGSSSGVSGLLRLSHGCPGPVREGDARRCDYAGANIVVRAFRAGATAPAGSDRTDAHGRFAIALPPGRYVLQAEVRQAKEHATAVSVTAGAWTAVTVRYLVAPYML